MKTIITKLTVILLVIGVLFSCTPDDICGTVTDYDIDQYGNYELWIDGDRRVVDVKTWWNYNVGDELCLTY